MENSKRIHLLSDTEVAELYVRPEFNIDEQTLYFTLNDAEQAVLDRYANTRTRTYFILQLGYFKAKQQFFKFNFEDVIDDTKFVIQTHFGKSAVPLSGGISRDYTRLQKQQILDLLDYRDWGNDVELPVSAQIGELLRYYPKGHSALRELLVYMGKQRIVIPSYRTLQDMFTAAFSAEEARLKAIIFSISAVQRDQLSNLLTREEGTSQLELIRVDQKDFQFTALRNEIDKASQLADLYELAKQFIPKLNLSQNAVRYYADVAEQYFTSRLRRLNKPQQWLHIICFVHHRYQQIMDSLVVSFLYHIRAVISGGKKHADAELAKHSSRMVVDFPKLAEFLAWFPERNKALSHNEVNQAAYDILPEKQFPELASFLAGNAFDKNAAKWRYYAKCTRLFSLYLRPILLVTPFVFYKEGNQLTALIDFLKTHYASGKNPATLRVPDDIRDAIPKKIQQYLTRESTELLIDPLLFEFYVYLKIYHQINRGKLCCNDSVSYGDVDYDLIDDARVDDADNVAAEFSYPKIRHYCDERLDEAIGALDLAWKTTTDNIQFDRNTGFNFKETKAGQQDWSLLYDSSEKLEDRFFKTLPKAEIADVVMFVGELAGMWDSFTHIKDRYAKRKKPKTVTLSACILSEAFGFGTTKMAEISDLDVNTLRSTREDFIRIDTLCDANDLVSNYTNSLPIFKLWNLLDDKVLADADGQKFATSNHTLQSRYSKKYLGKGRGISLYTLIANFVAVNAKNLGLNEYEGHCLYDMIYGNKTDIDIDSVTGDNHSLNKLNFVALDSIDVDYVPSIKNVRKAAEDLYSVQPASCYSGPLRPKGKINVELIKSQKRGILRVLLSLILQENTQTNIIRKLNSHTRYTRLRSALYEYNQIFKSTHVLT